MSTTFPVIVSVLANVGADHASGSASAITTTSCLFTEPPRKVVRALPVPRLYTGRRRPCVKESCGLHVEFLGFFCPLHDEAESRRGIFPHQLIDDAIGHDLI